MYGDLLILELLNLVLVVCLLDFIDQLLTVSDYIVILLLLQENFYIGLFLLCYGICRGFLQGFTQLFSLGTNNAV